MPALFFNDKLVISGGKKNNLSPISKRPLAWTTWALNKCQPAIKEEFKPRKEPLNKQMCWFVRWVAFDECVSIGFPQIYSLLAESAMSWAAHVRPIQGHPCLRSRVKPETLCGWKKIDFLCNQNFSDSANCQQERTRSALLETLYEELHLNSQSMMGLGGDDDKMENGGGGGGGGGFFESFKVSDIPPLDVAAALMLCMYEDWRNCPDACLSCFSFCLFVCF